MTELKIKIYSFRRFDDKTEQKLILSNIEDVLRLLLPHFSQKIKLSSGWRAFFYAFFHFHIKFPILVVNGKTIQHDQLYNKQLLIRAILEVLNPEKTFFEKEEHYLVENFSPFSSLEEKDTFSFFATKKSIAIIGASEKDSSYSNRAVLSYLKAGYTVYPVNINGGKIHGLEVYKSLKNLPRSVNYISFYVPAGVGRFLLEEAKEHNPELLYFNPGSYDEKMVQKAVDLGMNPLCVCSIQALHSS